MWKYFLRRLLWTIPVLLVATTLAFLVLHLIPGDPVNLMLRAQPASEEVRDNLRKKLGLDRPFLQQYVYFVVHAAQGDFGESFRYEQPVLQVVGSQFPATLELAAGGMVIGILGGLGLGIVAGLHPHGVPDAAAMFVAVLGISLPPYWTGMLLIYLFGVRLGWVPVVGRGLIALILPSIVLGTFAIGDVARLVRSSILEVMNEDFVRTARAKGLQNSRVILHHALRNSLIPVITMIGLELGLFITGGVITETVFSRQGIGALLVRAILEKDYPVVRTVILLTTSGYIFANFFVDLLYGLLDPRIQYE